MRPRPIPRKTRAAALRPAAGRGRFNEAAADTAENGAGTLGAGGGTRGFNEAAADTAENAAAGTLGAGGGTRGFNEAAADTAENGCTSRTRIWWTGRFNEAAADTAENGEVARQHVEALEASMRPRPIPRKTHRGKNAGTAEWKFASMRPRPIPRKTSSIAVCRGRWTGGFNEAAADTAENGADRAGVGRAVILLQ